MIFTIYGEPVEIIGQPMLDLLDPSTLDDPVVKVRSLNDATWVRDARLSRLKADGGWPEIDEACKRASDTGEGRAGG